MYSGLLNHCLREATSPLRQNKLACCTPLGSSRSRTHLAPPSTSLTSQTIQFLPFSVHRTEILISLIKTKKCRDDACESKGTRWNDACKSEVWNNPFKCKSPKYPYISGLREDAV